MRRYVAVTNDTVHGWSTHGHHADGSGAYLGISGYLEPRIVRPGLLSQSINPQTPWGGVGQSFGDFAVVNTDGALDAITAVTHKGARLYIYEVLTDGTLLLLINAIIRDVHPGDDNTLVFVLRDNLHTLDGPLKDYDDTYGGSGGLDGDAVLAGRPKPLTLGKVWNFSPLLIDAARNIYHLGNTRCYLDMAPTYVQPHMRGVLSISRDPDYTTENDLLTIAPAAGYYRMFITQGYGSYMRVGDLSSIADEYLGDITMGWASAALPGSPSYAAGSFEHLLREILLGSGISTTISIPAAISALGAQFGLHRASDDTTSRRQWLDRLCAGVGAIYALRPDNTLYVKQLQTYPVIPDITLDALAMQLELTLESPPAEYDTITANWHYGRNYAPQSQSFLQRDVSNEIKRAYNDACQVLTAVIARAVDYPRTHAIDIDTLWIAHNASDDLGLDEATMTTLYNFVCNLLATTMWRSVYSCKLPRAIFTGPEQWEIGTVVRLDNLRNGRTSANFQVVGSKLDLEAETVTLSLWGVV